MVQTFDPDKNARWVKNFMTLFFLYSIVIILVAYVSAGLMLMTITGWAQFTAYYTKVKSLEDHFINLYTVNTYYGKWILANWATIGFTGYKYLLPKIATSGIMPFVLLMLVAIRFRKPIFQYRPFQKESSVHGDAHWATEAEIIKVGLRSKKGMLLGHNKKGYLVADGFQHCLLFAPTGSGKGVGFVIPNLLFWEHSMICHDIKLENYDFTSGWRKSALKQDVYVWEPANPEGITHAYNPLDWVSDKPGQMVDDVQKFSNLILQKREFWENEARTLLVGVILYLLADNSKVKSFGEVVRTLRGNDFAYSMAVVLDTMGDKIHPVGYMNLAAFLQKADKERSGVVSTLNSGLELWANPIIDAATARSDFNPGLFRKKATTVYVGITPDNIQRLKSLMAMFYQQASDFLSKKLPSKDEKYGVMFLMDEFPTVGKLEQFLSGIAYFRGYRVRLFLIVQDTEQLKGTYEASGMNSFLSNSTYRVTFAANNMDTANLISQLCGNQTVESSSHSKPKFMDFNPASRSVNVSQSQRALLLPQEVIALPRDEQIILIEAAAPIRTKKIFYYKDKVFTKKLLPHIDLPTQTPVIIKPTVPQNPNQPNENLALPNGDAAAA